MKARCAIVVGSMAMLAWTVQACDCGGGSDGLGDARAGVDTGPADTGGLVDDAGTRDGGLDAAVSEDVADAGADTGGEDIGPVDAGTPWVVVAPSGRYLMTTDGKPFVPLGNQPDSNTYLFDWPDWETALEAHFQRMQVYGENTIRLDFDYSPGDEYIGVESQVGVWNEAHLAKLLRAFELADTYGIRVLAVPFVTSPWMWPSWKKNPYSTLVVDPYAFLQSPEARKAYGNRMEELRDRFSNRGTLLGWDLMNEADVLLNWGAIPDKPSMEIWISEIGNRVKNWESAAYGQTHLRMVSWSRTMGNDLNDDVPYNSLFQSPGLNCASTHPYDIYGSQPNLFPRSNGETFIGWNYDINDWGSMVQPAVKMNANITTILTNSNSNYIQDRRPYLEDERSPFDGMMPSFHTEVEHNFAWAELTSGSAGAGINWIETNKSPWFEPYGSESLGPFHLRTAVNHRAIKAFVEAIPVKFFLGTTTDEAFSTALTSPDSAVKVMSVRRGSYAIGWIPSLNERCSMVQSIQEMRQEVNGGKDILDLIYGPWGLVLWMKLLGNEG
ncbi:MAG: hypothetical protein HY897_06185, partial [Deltaproteobacteria bacterium]|nr:hypothetical protein [Deltaproteobacteria bacterium]